MAELKRYLVKYIRDGAKKAYEKGSECFICGSEESLDFHHFHSLAELTNKWVKVKKLNIQTSADLLYISCNQGSQVFRFLQASGKRDYVK